MIVSFKKKRGGGGYENLRYCFWYQSACQHYISTAIPYSDAECRLPYRNRNNMKLWVRPTASSLLSVSLSVSRSKYGHTGFIVRHPDSCPRLRLQIRVHSIPSSPEFKPKSNASPQPEAIKHPPSSLKANHGRLFSDTLDLSGYMHEKWNS